MTETDQPNPLQKLFEGFCSPGKIAQAPSYDDLNADKTNEQFAPDLAPQQESEEEKKEIAEETTVESTIAEDNSITTTTTVTPEESEDKKIEEESPPETEVAEPVAESGRKLGVGNFIVGIVFLLVTLLALEKFGYKTIDFDFGDVSSVVQKGTFQVQKVSIETPPEPAVEDPVVEEPVVSVDKTFEDEETVAIELDDEESEAIVDEL
mmetsp:Transcript_4813/g.10186  ORF Transcript_4813/g.10186 Transcript_4813/m.10186 type:complete len:208 (-) Transcript_4813:1516-2139(-)|eukprot:CAMPEP_0201116232 /NCGR_PEP_ID=MMETSP0850-20130426/573_1 /ASSEMBLY_ACC=CAM_ASM_000622 /TAXON_ID=183588 /ORGANISM="Pseudo-nitzschia fraudulenta, Strain WWA7" /LENGTH=207 /DNA_ID=CAMNT_0047380267 /DNA_START=102 /DNA_END=725 /DNA_ORIENTATION=+